MTRKQIKKAHRATTGVKLSLKSWVRAEQPDGFGVWLANKARERGRLWRAFRPSPAPWPRTYQEAEQSLEA